MTTQMDAAHERKEQKRGSQRRDALTLSAAELFWRHGYDATSIADIAGAAKIPVGNVYYYFRSKADLAEAVARLFVSQTEALISDVESQSQVPRDVLRLTIQRLKSSQAERVRYGCPIASACHEFSRAAPEAAKVAGESFTLLAGLFARQLTAMGQRPSVALTRARALICEWQGGIAVAHALDDSQILAEAFARMERMALQA
ncbi:MAG: TetR family transcriptional regulator [Pseudomonadota bacterium]